jgi:hypothetical protein
MLPLGRLRPNGLGGAATLFQPCPLQQQRWLVLQRKW